MRDYSFVHLKQGFGNKMFQIFYGIWLRKTAGINVVFVYSYSKHEKYTDIQVINCIKLDHFYYQGILGWDEFRDYIKKFGIREVSEKDITTDIIKKGGIFYNDYFVGPKYFKEAGVNWDKVLGFSRKPIKQLAIHCRYGDKLAMILSDKNKFKWLVINPDWYVGIITKFAKEYPSLPISIYTDSSAFVQKYIVSKLGNIKNRIKIPNTNACNSFKDMANSTHLLISDSTLSMVSGYLSKGKVWYYRYLIKGKGHPIEENPHILENWIGLGTKKDSLNLNKKKVAELKSDKWVMDMV